METYKNELIFIKAPELPLKCIEIAPQIRGEILKAGAEVFWQGDNFFDLLSSGPAFHTVTDKQLKQFS